jgi:uncharacterized protein YcfJ
MRHITMLAAATAIALAGTAYAQEPAPTDTTPKDNTTSAGGGAIVGGTAGAVTGAVVGGPVGAVVGGVAGAAIGGSAEAMTQPPPETVTTYIRANRSEPVVVEGDVVVGTTLPETVVLSEVPDYEYRYVYVDQRPMLVEPQTRKVVYVIE